MNLTTSLRTVLTRGLLIGASLLLIGYGLFEGRKIIEGPQVEVAHPFDGATVAGPLVRITGSAKNTAFFSINGKQAFIDEKGNFSETVSPEKGYPVFTIVATDRFGRTEKKMVRVHLADYCPAGDDAAQRVASTQGSQF